MLAESFFLAEGVFLFGGGRVEAVNVLVHFIDTHYIPITTNYMPLYKPLQFTLMLYMTTIDYANKSSV